MGLDNTSYPFLSLSQRAAPAPCCCAALLPAADHHSPSVRQYDAGRLCMLVLPHGVHVGEQPAVRPPLSLLLCISSFLDSLEVILREHKISRLNEHRRRAPRLAHRRPPHLDRPRQLSPHPGGRFGASDLARCHRVLLPRQRSRYVRVRAGRCCWTQRCPRAAGGSSPIFYLPSIVPLIAKQRPSVLWIGATTKKAALKDISAARGQVKFVTATSSVSPLSGNSALPTAPSIRPLPRRCAP